MQGDTTTKPNPNETILIPMLHKRVGELTSENILLQARLQWAEHEKAELLGEVGAKTQRILDLEHSEAPKIEAAQSAVRAESEKEKAAAVEKATTNMRAALERAEQEKTALRVSTENEKRTIVENWQRELQMQTGNLKAQIQALTEQLNTANATIASLQSVKLVDPPKPEAKRKGKKDVAVMGGGTF